MRNLKDWGKFLLEEEATKMVHGHIWWGVPHGNDETGGFLFCLTPITENKPEKGTPAETATLFFEDLDGECDEFEEGTDEYEECMAEAEDRWQNGFITNVYERVYFVITISTIGNHRHPKGGYVYQEWENPLPRTVTSFIGQFKEKTKHYIYMGSTKTPRMAKFIRENFFLNDLYLNDDAVGIVKNLDGIMGSSPGEGMKMLVDQLKSLIEQGVQLDYYTATNTLKAGDPLIYKTLVDNGVDLERMDKLDKARKLLKNKRF